LKSKKRKGKHCQMRNQSEDDAWITTKIRKKVEKRIWVLEQQLINNQTQSYNLINIDVVRSDLLSQIHPFIPECQKV
jgi:translation initiation factor IF-1